MKKSKASKQNILALATLMGTTIGVGIYAMPWSFAKFPFFSFLILGLALVVMNILYRLYIRLITDIRIGNHQLPGITERILSKKLKNIVGIPLLISRSGVLFLYLTIFGSFSKSILAIFDISISPVIPAIFIAGTCSLFVRKKLRSIGKINLYLSIGLIVIVSYISGRGLISYLTHNTFRLPSIIAGEVSLLQQDPANFVRNIGLTYGVSIGALSGIAAIPSLEVVVEERKKLNIISLIGSILTAALYSIFILFILSHSENIAQDALSNFDDSYYMIVLLIAGLLSTITSFIGVGRSLFEIYTFDYKFPDNLGWILTLMIPIIMYLTGVANFAGVVGLIGGVVGGIEGLLIVANYTKLMKMNKTLSFKKKILLALFAVFLLWGIIFTI